MKTTLGYRLFHWGGLSAERRSMIEAEGLLILDEGVPIRVTYRNYRAPGKRFGYRRSSGSGAIALTRRRFAAFYYRWPLLDLALDDPRFPAVEITSPGPDTLLIVVDAAALDPRRSGHVSMRFRTDRAHDVILSLSSVHR
jgi:hypothetical protein